MGGDFERVNGRRLRYLTSQFLLNATCDIASDTNFNSIFEDFFLKSKVYDAYYKKGRRFWPTMKSPNGAPQKNRYVISKGHI